MSQVTSLLELHTKDLVAKGRPGLLTGDPQFLKVAQPQKICGE